jgi:hypothetical protein
LSAPAGRVEVAGTIDPKTQRLRLKWTEKSGPAVQAPKKRPRFGNERIKTDASPWFRRR